MTRVVLWPLLLLLGVLIMRWTSWAESRVFYIPDRAPFATPPEYVDVSIPTPDGLSLHGWLMPPAGNVPKPWPAVLHCHGNAGNVSLHADFSSFLTDHGIAVLIFDYRGYGRSSAASGLVRDKLLTDSRAALEFLLTQPDIDPARVGALGVSLGGVFASALAGERSEIRAVCLVNAFSSWRGVATDHAPVLGRLFIADGLDPVSNLRSGAGRPVLIVHSERDEIIHPRHAGLLADGARAGGWEATTFIAPGVDHNSVLSEGSDEQRAVAEFFVRTLAPQ
ncbi:MAG: hypothetical protein GIKADHBN_00358 [Phycisphaerales bacterium]|nr:hypothetical protein [Phycisphaerales bacterium]